MKKLALRDTEGLHHAIDRVKRAQRIHAKVMIRNLRDPNDVVRSLEHVHVIDQAALELGAQATIAWAGLGGFILSNCCHGVSLSLRTWMLEG
jgi:hypothetical protein